MPSPEHCSIPSSMSLLPRPCSNQAGMMLLHPVPAARAAAAISSPLSSCRASPLGGRRHHAPARCAPTDDDRGGAGVPDGVERERAKAKATLKVGSPIVVLEAPPMLKTAASVPSLRHNAGQVKAGDVGRVMARKPKDVWAVRLAAGTFLLDGKHFKPLEIDDEGGVESPQKDT